MSPCFSCVWIEPPGDLLAECVGVGEWQDFGSTTQWARASGISCYSMHVYEIYHQRGGDWGPGQSSKLLSDQCGFIQNDAQIMRFLLQRSDHVCYGGLPEKITQKNNSKNSG